MRTGFTYIVRVGVGSPRKSKNSAMAELTAPKTQPDQSKKGRRFLASVGEVSLGAVVFACSEIGGLRSLVDHTVFARQFSAARLLALDHDSSVSHLRFFSARCRPDLRASEVLLVI